MNFLLSQSEKALDYVVELLKQQVAYLIFYKSKVKDLNGYVEYLGDARDKVQHQVESERRNGKEIEDEVEKWLKKVDTIIAEHNKFQKDEDHAKTGCSDGSFPNPLSRYTLGKKAHMMAKQVDELQKKSKFDRFSWQGPMSMDSVLFTIGYESFKSRNATIDKIMKMLGDSSVRMIGVYGPGGVGKTTLVKKVASKVQDKFKLVMASVTRNPDGRKIQGEIAAYLGLRLDEESEVGRADRIRERLKKEEKSTLIILDDLWVGLDLNKLGIPSDDGDFSQRTAEDEGMPKIDYNKMAEKEKSPVDQGMYKPKIDYKKMAEKEKSPVDQRMCKILLTSRFKEVLSDKMDVDENSIVPVKVLEEKEAETLFQKVAGVHDKHSVPEPLVAKVAKKCGRLPIAIVTVGRALRDKSESEWNDSLRQLERQEFRGMREPLEFSTRLSFNHLENEELKSTFLICAQMGHHPLIMDLMKYCFGLGILQRVHTIKEARDRTLTLIRKLKDSSLLSDSNYTDRFNMHDMVRDVALSISTKERHVFIVRDEKLDEWPEKDELKRYTSISLHNCDIIDDSPEGITCPQLKVFHIDGGDPCMKIPSNFKGNTKLRVLILTGIRVLHLPFSIESLANLRMLCLERCQLGDTNDLSIIGKLEKLKILSFSGSEIENLPSELGHLSKLQLFDISNCSGLRFIPPNVISRLDSLEELYMGNSPIQWGFEDQTNGIQNATLAELSHLHQLTNLDVCVPDVAVFPRSLFLDKLDSYKIVIGDSKMLLEGDFKMPDKYEASRALALEMKEGIGIHTQKGVKMLFRRVVNLLLGELNGVRNVFYELNLEGFPCLRHFSIVNNSDIQCIIDSREMSHAQDAFPKLESMCLYKLKNMKTICCSKLTKTSFCKLKIIKIKICAQLKNIFPFSMVGLLEKLETIEVSECHSLESIVVGEGNANNNGKDVNKIEFPQLCSLSLQSLPTFTSFYTNDHGAINSASIFSEQVNIPNLETLELSSINNKFQKIWSGQPSPTFCFQNLVKLNVKDCNGLTYLFTFSEAKKLENLKTISVSECYKMDKIFEQGKINTMEAKVDIFPKLEEFYLTSMGSLSEIWNLQVGLNSFPNLSSVVIEECGKLVTIFPCHMVGRFRRLDNLKIVRCSSVKDIFDLKDAPQTNGGGNETNLRFVYIERLPNLKHVWNRDPKGIISFKNMQRIEVHYCHDLENLFPPSLAKGLEKLDSLSIIGCRKLREIARKEGSETGNIHFEFPLLSSLTFTRLPELESFYPGRHSLECPSLKKLTVDSCDKLEIFTTETTTSNNQALFLPEKVVSNLELMAISQKEAERLKCCIGNYRMHRLKELHFYSFQDIDLLFWFLHRIPKLERLMLNGCFLKEVLPSGSLVAHEKIGTVVQIKDLTLTMPILENIGFEHDLVLQRLERLVLLRCSNLIILAPSTVSFTHLKSLEVSQCDKLSNLMASSAAKSLVELTRIRVAQCKAMEEIVAKERNEEERVDEIVFSKLMTIELVSLKNLTSFCNFKNLNLNFPVLEKLIVRECPKMKTFSEGLTTAQILRKVYLAYAEGEEEGKWYWEDDLNATIRKIYTDMVSFEYPEDLKLSDYPKLEQVWHGQVSLPDNCFRNLKILQVANCDFLSSAIPFNLLSYLKNLEELRVQHCNLVEVIIDMNDTNMTKSEGKAFRLKTLILGHLPNLKHLWNRDPQGVLSFQNLQRIHIYSCKRLKTLFPKSVAKNLLKLHMLSVDTCQALEEIVGKEDAAADGAIDEKFEFPCLASLYLSELPEMKCFYPGRFNLKCPMLKTLSVYRCGKLEIFTSESQSYRDAVPEDQNISIKAQPLFLVQEVIPILEKVTLSEKDTKMLWHDHGRCQENLQNLKWLRLQCFHNVNETDHLPYEILQNVPNIETLAVACSGFKEIFLPHKLKQLALHALPRLYSIGLQNSQIDQVGESLEMLAIFECPCLTKLVPSSVSFSNLKQLTIFQCHGLVCLFTLSTAKSLVRLEMMAIGNCESLKEIMAKEGDEADPADEIIFEQLQMLFLNSLSSLASFYIGNATLKFPKLNEMCIIQCPRMKTFSQGDIWAPRLGAIEVSFSTDFRWEQGLEFTVDKLFNEKVSFAFMESLKLYDYPELEQLWLGKIPLPDNCFSKLRTLLVENCEFLSDVIPSHLLPYLKNLEELQIRNCSSVEVIFDTSKIELSATEEKASFLKKLTLDQLPNLKFVWNKNPQRIIIFEKLQKVKVSDCESLQYLFPAASMAKSLVKLKIQNCGALVEILGKDDAVAGASDTFEFPHLTMLILNHLPELSCFHSGTLNLKLSKLKVLNVYHCNKLEIVTSETKSNQALPEDEAGVSVNASPVFLVKEVIINLEELSLNEKEIEILWHGEFPANFLHNIKSLQLYCFHSITDQEDILPFGFLHKVPNLEILAVACSDFKEIFPSKGLEDEYIRMLSNLKGLRLEALPLLNTIGLEHSWLVPLDENLETLEICRCSNLTKIVQSAVSFSNLKVLSVTKCHKLVCLFTSSTAKSLVQLRKMYIEKCESMREIVAKEEEESTEDEIVFGELTKLSLNNLSSLGCFYTGNLTLRFPYLQEVIIAQCSKMKVFSEGFISAPQLPGIQASLEKWDLHWEGDLNSTVKKLSKGKEVIVYP